MIYPQTILSVTDNTGAQKVMCIKILGGNKKYGKLGDSIIGVIKEITPNILLKRSTIVKAVIVRTRKPFVRKDGTSISFDDNAVVIINKENNPYGTRIFGPIAREIRNTKFSKIISLASEII